MKPKAFKDRQYNNVLLTQFVGTFKHLNFFDINSNLHFQNN